MRELNAQVAEMAGQSPELVDVPDFMASLIAKFGFLPGAPLSSDQWLMLQHDNVSTGDLPGFKAFGISPTPIGSVARNWLSRYRKGGRFAPGNEVPSAG
jgi:NADH dehydrogenase